MTMLATQNIGIDQDGALWQYVPPSVVSVGGAPAGAVGLNLAGAITVAPNDAPPAGVWLWATFGSSPAPAVTEFDGTTTVSQECWIIPVVS